MRWKQTIYLSGINFLVLLFTYAGLSKFLEWEEFYLNLLNSPLLPVPETWTVLASWGLPVTELFLVVLLIYPKTKLIALCMSIGILSLYILYLLALIFLAPYQPCSCGGIIALLTWEQQLWFTLGCLSFASLTLFLKKSEQNKKIIKHA